MKRKLLIIDRCETNFHQLVFAFSVYYEFQRCVNVVMILLSITAIN